MDEYKQKTDVENIQDLYTPKSKEELVVADTGKSQVNAVAEADLDITDDLSMIKVEEFSLDRLDKNYSLVEITDNQVLATITQIVPNAAQMAAATANAVVAAGEPLYKVVLPAGEKMVAAADGDGLRAFSREAGRIKSHGRLYEVDPSVNKALNATAAVMSVASIVVGQYYMTQINSKLEKISSKIDKVADFQEDEYKGKVVALVLQIRKLSSNQLEILQNDRLCAEKIASLNNFEHKCIELLGQANSKIQRITQQKCIEFKEYEEAVNTVNGWYDYQQVLIEILYQIADLEYTLHKGTMSLEQCSSLLQEYSNQVTATRDALSKWHKTNMKAFEVDTSRMKRKRDGVEGALFLIPGLFDANLNYDDLSKDTARILDKHLSHHRGYSQKKQGFYAEDVQLITDKGKWYYLAPADKKEIKGFDCYLEEHKKIGKTGKSGEYKVREPEHKVDGEYRSEIKKDNVVIADETIYITQKKVYKLGSETIKLPDMNYKEVLVYTPNAGEVLLKEDISKYQKDEQCHIEVCNDDSFATASRYEKPFVMNFANAFRAGGGFRNGANAQEEALCRCSTLYASISSPMAIQMYSHNKSRKNPLTSDYMLLSPNVCVFRDKDCEFLKEPFMASVITIPAPNRNGEAMHESRERIEEAMKRRIRIMFHIAIQKGYSNLILGAWGCGAFGNDPYDVAGYFRAVLIDENYGKCFDTVCFAVLDKEDGTNIAAFRECFD